MRKTSIRIIILLFTASLAFACQTKTVVPEVKVTPENALQSYLDNGDQSFKWEVQDSTQTEGARIYRLIFTSQTWRDTTTMHFFLSPEEVSTTTFNQTRINGTKV